MNERGILSQAAGIRAHVDDGLLAALLQQWQKCLCDGKCANNICQKDMLHVFQIPASIANAQC